MLQTIHGVTMFIVEFDTMPELPITWSNETEKPYALALGAAIATGIVTEPGKYGITVQGDVETNMDYNIWSIKD